MRFAQQLCAAVAVAAAAAAAPADDPHWPPKPPPDLLSPASSFASTVLDDSSAWVVLVGVHEFEERTLAFAPTWRALCSGSSSSSSGSSSSSSSGGSGGDSGGGLLRKHVRCGSLLANPGSPEVMRLVTQLGVFPMYDDTATHAPLSMEARAAGSPRLLLLGARGGLSVAGVRGATVLPVDLAGLGLPVLTREELKELSQGGSGPTAAQAAAAAALGEAAAKRVLAEVVMPRLAGLRRGDAAEDGTTLLQKRAPPAGAGGGDASAVAQTWALALLGVAGAALLWQRGAAAKKARVLEAARRARAAYEARRARDALLAAEEKKSESAAAAAAGGGGARAATPEARAKAAKATRQRLKQQLLRTNAATR